MIELYWGDLDVGDDELARRRSTLSAAELRRASRYAFQRDRRRFIARRGMLRAILAERLRASPSDLELVADRWGKPFLVGSDAALSFNLSHSGSLGAVVLADGRPVGVDVEVVRPEPGNADIARHFFSPAEVSGLLALPAPDFGLSFLRVWTRKEACVKAVGQGLSIPLDSFDVSVGYEARLLAARGGPLAAEPWSLAEASGWYFGMEAVASVAAAGSGWALVSVPWHGEDRRELVPWDERGQTEERGVVTGDGGRSAGVGIRGTRRRAASIRTADLVETVTLDGRDLPVVMTPAVDGVDLAAWAGQHRP